VPGPEVMDSLEQSLRVPADVQPVDDTVDDAVDDTTEDDTSSGAMVDEIDLTAPPVLDLRADE